MRCLDCLAIEYWRRVRRFKLVRRVPNCSLPPRFYGLAWKDYYLSEGVYLPLGLHVVVGYLRLAWLGLRRWHAPDPWREEIQRHGSAEFARGRGEGFAAGRRAGLLDSRRITLVISSEAIPNGWCCVPELTGVPRGDRDQVELTLVLDLFQASDEAVLTALADSAASGAALPVQITPPPLMPRARWVETTSEGDGFRKFGAV